MLTRLLMICRRIAGGRTRKVYTQGVKTTRDPHNLYYVKSGVKFSEKPQLFRRFKLLLESFISCFTPWALQM